MRSLALICTIALAVVTSAHADYQTIGAFSYGTRTASDPLGTGVFDFELRPNSIATFGQDPRNGFNFSDATLKFSLGSVPGEIISATLSFNVVHSLGTAGQNGPSLPLVLASSATTASPLGLSDFTAPGTIASANVPNFVGFAGSPGYSLALDVTNAIRRLVAGSYPAVLFQLDDPLRNSGIILSTPDDMDAANRPSLTIIYASSSVPEPASVVMIVLGIGSMTVGARRVRS